MGGQTSDELAQLRTEIAELKARMEARAEPDAAGTEPAADEDGAHRRPDLRSVTREVREAMSEVEDGLGDLKEEVERHPLGSVLIAFCVGLLVGKLSGR